MSACRYCGVETDAKPVILAIRAKPEGDTLTVCRTCQVFFNHKFAAGGMVLVPASSSGQHGASLSSRLLARAGRRDAKEGCPVGAGGRLGLPPADLTDWSPGELMEAYGK